jgi:hypothetical protein
VNSWWLLILLPVGFAVAWFTVFRKPAGESIAGEKKYKNTGPVEISRNDPVEHEHHYYGASVQICSNPCDAARDIADKRFLSEDAPHFPLPDCDRDECRCIMRPQDDRRAGYSRRGDSFSAYGNFELDRHDQKRDKKKDRRK